MIIKGRSRARAAQLAAHLLNARDNERICLHECRGVVSQSVEGALTEMVAQGAGGRSRKPLYHASISPDPRQPMTDAQLATAVDVLEARLGFQGQPRIVVVHRKQGREHVHVVWSRIDRTGRAIPDGWNYVRHEEAAREHERLFGHTQVTGAFSTHPAPRRRRPKEYEMRQASRSGVDRQTIRDDLKEAWAAAGTGEAFRAAIESRGYRLVRGDRRGFVVLDRAGEAHSLARCLGLRTAALDSRLDRALLATLPDVKTARAAMKVRARYPDVNEFMIRSFAIQSDVRTQRVRPTPTRSRTYAADRASIVSDFASKISAACSPGATREEIAARIRRLRDEEAAALLALKQRSQGQGSHLRMTYRVAGHEVTRPRKSTRRLVSRRLSLMPTE